MTIWEMAIQALEALDMGRPLDAKGHLRNILLNEQGAIGMWVSKERWEYFVWLPPGPEHLLRELGNLGRSGWELVLRYDDKFIFKRQMSQYEEEL